MHLVRRIPGTPTATAKINDKTRSNCHARDIGAMMPGNGVGNIGTRFPRLKHPSRYPKHRRPPRCIARNTKWKRLLAPFLVLLLFAMMAELDGRLLSQTGRRAIAAVLADPLSLLSERSPGLRGEGTLLSIKGRPRERVLSTARDRQPTLPEAIASIPIIPPQYDTTLAENRLGGFPPPTAAIPGSQAGNPGFVPEGLPVSGPYPSHPPARLLAATPLETTTIPEPASWTMVAGPLAVGVLVRQYARKRRPA
jgi:hypothetical protein